MDPTPLGPTLKLTDLRLIPHSVSIDAGRQVTIKVENTGKVLHNLSIPSIEGDVDLEPGQSTNLIFIAPKTGPVEFFCKYHRDQGMTGSFTIRGAP